MSHRKSISCPAIIAIALFAACSDSSTQPGTDLTTEQVQSMSSALSLLLGVSLGHPQQSFTSPAPLSASRVMAQAFPISGSTACPEGGRVGTNGSFSTDTLGNAIFALTDTLVDCAIKGNHSVVWAFTSKPTVAVTIVDSTNIHGDIIDVSHSAHTQTDVGTVHYATGSISGSCALNVSIAVSVDRGFPTADSATYHLQTTGTLCGRSVSRDTSSTLPYTPPPG